MKKYALIVALSVGACAPTDALEAEPTPELAAVDEVEPEREPECDSEPEPEPAWGSVAWLLRQPYAACDDGHRASDNIATLFMAHPSTGRCTFPCAAELGLCERVDGQCDAAGLCVPAGR